MWNPENGQSFIRYPADTTRLRLRRLVSRFRQRVTCWRHHAAVGPRIAVGLSDHRRARQVRSVIAWAVTERARAIGFALPAETTILVDRSISVGDAPAISCLDVIAPRDPSARRYLIRIGLEGPDGPRELDEVIADLDHQVLSLFYHLSGSPSPRLVTRPSDRVGETGDWSVRLANVGGQTTRSSRSAEDIEGREQSNGSTG
jgi:mRNA-degrading endonuclease toxin of MazEF toxin-antitoxin module